MKIVSIISLSIILAACGGSSGGNGPDVSTLFQKATYDIALTKCGNNVPQDISNYTLTGADKNVILSPDQGAKLLIEGSGHSVCISGSMSTLTITGSGHSVYVNGSISTLTISGSESDVLIFDDVLALKVSGSENDIWIKTVATYTDNGTENNLLDIDKAKL